MSARLKYLSPIVPTTVYRVFALFPNSLFAEGLWELFRALPILHARSIKIVLATRPINHIVNNNIIEL